MNKGFLRVASLVLMLFPALSVAQSKAVKVPPERVALFVEQYKQDPKGPYRDIRWFCPDGSTLAPAERCPQPGVQRARYKDDVLALAASNHIFLGQILSTTGKDDFWDEGQGNSRLKQYGLEKYLRQIDDGWINRKAKSYRGAYQAEDEDAWGLEFLRWLVQDSGRLASNFFVIRQAVRDIPHGADNDLAQRVRTTSKEVSDAYPPFMNLRVKIHGQPDEFDADRVRQFRDQHSTQLTPALNEKLDALIVDLGLLFRTANLEDLEKYVGRLSASSPVRAQLADRLKAFKSSTDPQTKAASLANTALYIRKNISLETSGAARLNLLDISARLEELLTVNVSSWSAESLGDELGRLELLTTAAAAFGFLELWEYDQAIAELERLRKRSPIPLASLKDYLDQTRRLVEWSTLTVHATYEDVVALYSAFEPLAGGLFDEKVRASVLLPMGRSVGRLGEFVATEAGFRNEILGITNQAQGRGLNPGFARGQLVVVQGDPESVEIDPSRIYLFSRPPADLKPVAGILTVTEGNMVSHVQLLARNLGIPNGVISAGNLRDLSAFDGRNVFLAVSNSGTIVLKLASDMSLEEQRLFDVKARAEEKITVPVHRMNLGEERVLNLAGIDATWSGVVTGPKAANLGQLKVMFPENVVDGLVLPFGIFRRHMDQQMASSGSTYWEFLTAAFSAAAAMRAEGATDEMVETFILGQLEVMRTEIKRMPLLPEFVADFKRRFKEILGTDLGSIPVFVRSDTNMEDLKDFTGAGLNLTLFNVLDEQKILQGIKDVWASPYTERSFRWRQRYLLNPENVYPSILVIPSVDADYSGVMITKGVGGGDDADATVAFNRGVGGAVDGQAAETWLLKASGKNLLLSPAREMLYTSIPATGGVSKVRTGVANRILSPANLNELRDLGATIERRLSETVGVETGGPFDIELGFKDDKVWLFQVRPFVENKKALSSEYLQSISPTITADKPVQLSSRMP